MKKIVLAMAAILTIIGSTMLSAANECAKIENIVVRKTCNQIEADRVACRQKCVANNKDCKDECDAKHKF